MRPIGRDRPLPIQEMPDGKLNSGAWCLQGNIASYDFGAYLVFLRTIGINQLLFRYREPLHANKFPDHIVWNRVRHLLIPFCELAGVKWAMVQDYSGEFAPVVTSYGHFYQIYHMNNGRVWLYDTKDKANLKNYVTITLRKSHAGWQPARDSNEEAWRQVAKELESRGKTVIIMEDLEEKSVPLRERFALYMNADMNLGTSTGPMMLCHFSKAPYITYKMIPETEPEKSHIKENFEISKFPIGGQFPWAHERQRLVWESDTFETIMKHYEEVAC